MSYLLITIVIIAVIYLVLKRDRPDQRIEQLRLQGTSTSRPNLPVKRKLQDFFSIDIDNLPDEEFIAAEISTNSAGGRVEHFRRRLNYKECGLFDNVEVVKFENGDYNILFFNYKASSLQRSDVENFINDLVIIYGRDRDEKTVFTAKDWEDFNHPDFDILFGRWWENKKPLYDIKLDKFEDTLQLTVWR